MDLKKFLLVHLWGLLARLGGHKKNVYNIFIRRFYLPMRRKPLWDFVKETKPERILEIGLGDGYNAEKMMELTDDCEYYCFDNLYMRESKEAYEDLKDKGNVSFFVGDTKKTLPEHVRDLPKMDLIFIDGGHDYDTVKNDWEHCSKLMHKDTACFFHDYNLPGVKRVVNEINGGKYRKRIIKLSKPPNSALVTKQSGG